MNIPENFKKIWLGLITLLMGVLIIFVIIISITMTKGNNNDQMPATITITGKGEIKAVPDISRFMVTIEETAKDQRTALDQTSKKVQETINGLVAIGISQKDIKTEYTNINPKYEYQSTGRSSTEIAIYPPGPGKQVIVGYTSSETLSVKVRDLEKVSPVRQLFADQGAQNVYGPELSIDDPEQLKDNTRQQAIIDAKSQAKVLAKQLGVRLGKIVSFSDANNGGMYTYGMSVRSDMMSMEKANSAPEANIEAGEQIITSNVSITYKIR